MSSAEVLTEDLTFLVRSGVRNREVLADRLGYRSVSALERSVQRANLHAVWAGTWVVGPNEC